MFKDFISPIFVCYDNEDKEKSAEDESGTSTGAEAKETVTIDGIKIPSLTKVQQEAVNSIVSKQKREVKAKVEEQLTAKEQSISDLLDARKISEEQAQSARDETEAIRAQFRTDEENLKLAQSRQKAEYEGELNTERKRGNEAVLKYEKMTVNHAIGAAVVEHEGLSTDQFTDMFGSTAKVVDDNPLLVFRDEDKDQKRFMNELHPSDALKRMKELPLLYGNLFKKKGKSGIGGDGSPESGNLSPDKVDVSKLSFDEYKKLRKENPASLGLT